MRYIESTSMVFLFGFVVLISTNTVYAADTTQYEKILEKIDSLSLVLNDNFKTNIENNWDAASHVQQYKIQRTIDSVDRLERSYHQKEYPELTDPLRHLRALLKQADTIEQILKYQDKMTKLEQSIAILDSSNKVKQVLKYNAILDSQVYLQKAWMPIQEKIQSSKNVDDILSLKMDIDNMQKMIEYNQLIHENVHSPVFTIIDPHVKLVWNEFHTEMSQAKSLTEMTKIATSYYGQVGQIDDTIIDRWEDKITMLEESAQRQKNIPDILRIEQNIKTLNMVKKIEQGKNPFDGDEQSKAILHNISQNYLKIKSDLKEYSIYLHNKKQMEQKATQFQNRATDRSSAEKMPEFEPKIKDTLKRASHVKSVLDLNDFKHAQQLLDALEQEWVNFERFYPEIRNYAPIYKQTDLSTTQKKQIYLDQISDIEMLVSGLGINHTSSDYQKYRKSIQESKSSILYGNFELGHKKIYNAIDFVSQKFLSHDPLIMTEIEYDQDSNMWNINGAVYKHSLHSRGTVSFYLLDLDSKIMELDSRTTRYGNFQILWNGHIEPGLYVAEIRHGSATESQIISIPDDSQEMVFNKNEIAIMEIANTFETLENFVKKFTDSGSEKRVKKIQSVISKIKKDLTGGQLRMAAESLEKFKNNIKLYLPIQSPEIVIDASVTKNTVKITGKVAKTVEHRETLFLTVFDQDGRRIFEQMTYDDKYGNINIEIPKQILNGFTVIQVEYHNSLARDIVDVTSIL